MNRTWDAPELLYLRPGTSAVDACPSLAPLVANFAIRGGLTDEQLTESRVQLGAARRFAGRLGLQDFIDRFSTESSATPQRFPSFEETAEAVDANLSGIAEIPTVFESDVRAALDRRAEIFNKLTKGRIAPPFMVSLGDYLEQSRERFTDTLAEVMIQPDTRSAFMTEVDAYARRKDQEVRQKLEDGPVDYNFIIEGGGVHTANLVATLQECIEGVKILVIDTNEDRELGGQFRHYGKTPVFDMNSGTGQENTVRDVYGLPKNGGNLNSFGLHAALQLPDFVGTDLPTNVDPAHAAAINIVLSGADIVFANRTFMRRGAIDGNQVYVDDLPYAARSPEATIKGLGIGRPTGMEIGRPAAEVFRSYGRHMAGLPHQAEKFAGRTGVVYGCGDSGKSLVKLLMGQGPKEAYQNWSARKGGRPRTVYWVAPDFTGIQTKQDQKSGVRPIYAATARFFPEELGDTYAPIQPVGGRLVGRVGDRAIIDNNGSTFLLDTADFFLGATGVTDPGDRDSGVRYLRSQGEYVFDQLGSRIASAVDLTDRVYSGYISLGPVVPLGIKNDAGVPANTASIWSAAAADTLTGYWLAQRSRARGRSSDRRNSPFRRPDLEESESEEEL